MHVISNHDAAPGWLSGLKAPMHRYFSALIGAMVSFVLCLTPVQGATVDPDASYGTDGRLLFSLDSVSANVGSALLQPDGKLLISGWRQTGTLPIGNYGAIHPGELFVRRINGDGSPDLSFGVEGESRFSVLGADTINQIRLQDDGKIILAVSAREPCVFVMFFCYTQTTPQRDSIQRASVVRLTPRGELDSTFGTGGIALVGTPWSAAAVAVQADGKIVLLGSTSIPRARIYAWAMVRLDSAGAVDMTFNGGKPVTSNCPADSLRLLPSSGNRFLVAGTVGAWFGSQPNPQACLERINEDGNKDMAFGSNSPGWMGTALSY